MFRRLYDAAARLLSPRTPLSDKDLVWEPRTPDPYAWRLPNPYDARWRRWFKRSRATGRHLPFPAEEACWHSPPHPQLPPWQGENDPVHPYVPRSDVEVPTDSGGDPPGVGSDALPKHNVGLHDHNGSRRPTSRSRLTGRIYDFGPSHRESPGTTCLCTNRYCNVLVAAL